MSPRVEQAPESGSKTVETTLAAKGHESPKPSVKTPPAEEDARKPSLISVIRYWNTEDYTRLVINTDREVKYIEGRLDNPTRVFIDIQNVRLSPALTGKTIVLNDGYVSKIRLGQSQETVARVVVDMGSFKSCQVLQLSNPSRIVVDVQGVARIEQSKTSPGRNDAWKVRYGEPLADEMDLKTALQRGSAAKATEEKNVAAKSTEPNETKEPTPMKQEVSKKPTRQARQDRGTQESHCRRSILERRNRKTSRDPHCLRATVHVRSFGRWV